MLAHFPRLRSRAIATSVAGALLINALIAWAVWQSYREALSDGRRNAERLVQLVEAQSRKAFQSADNVLLHLKEMLERSDEPPTDDAATREKLRERAAALPHVIGVFAAGPDGAIKHSTGGRAVIPADITGQKYFTVHQHTPERDLFVGQPMTSGPDAIRVVPLSRRVERNGAFNGVVVATVDTRFFTELHGMLKLGPHDSIALFSTDATLLARIPEIESRVGRSWSQFRLFRKHLPEANSGTFSSRSFNGRRAIISYRVLESLPMVVTVVLDQWRLLAGWRRAALAWWIAAVLGTGLVIVLGLVVSRYRRERQIALARALQAQKLEALGQMTGGIAHDFNNVLGVVGASFRLIRRSGADEQYVAAGEQALERGARLATQLMSFAKSHELSRGLENANELLRSLAPIVKQAAGPNVRVSYELENAIPPCLVDRAQFDAAIINLVVNGAQAMNHSGEIVISTHSVIVGPGGESGVGQYVAVRVRDNGCGIAPADLKRVFEPFYTTKAEGGTGLGLAQVDAFVRQIGGDIRIQSKVGAGTTVELRFPCWDTSAVQSAESSDRQREPLAL